MALYSSKRCNVKKEEEKKEKKKELRELICINNLFQVKDNQSLTFQFFFPGVPDNKIPPIYSYLDLLILSTSTNVIPINKLYNTWCMTILLNLGVFLGRSGADVFNYRVISLFDCHVKKVITDLFASCPQTAGVHIFVDQLGLIIYIINKAQEYEQEIFNNGVPGFGLIISNSIQTAIWTIMVNKITAENIDTVPLVTHPSAEPFDENIVRFIIRDAYNAVHCIRDYFKIPLLFKNPQFVLALIDINNPCGQPLFLQIDLSTFVNLRCDEKCKCIKDK